MKIIVEVTHDILYKYHNSRLSHSNGLLTSKLTPTAKHKDNTMKNIKLNTSRKAGFSLVEMLVVIAIIGIIAAIAIPNIGNLNDSAREASARRNAQTVASVVNAAIAAGAPTALITDKAEALAAAETGLKPTTGAFAGKTFTSGAINTEDRATVLTYLVWDNDNKQLNYKTTEQP